MSTSSQGGKRPREDAQSSRHPEGLPTEGAVTKKARIDNDAAMVERDHDIWIEDGTAIVVARNAVKFRVYAHVLGGHSTILADMLSRNPPAASQAAVLADGSPIIHLDDSPEDVRHVLRALFPADGTTPTSIDIKRPTTFNVISAYARLGHKYKINALLESSLAYLKECFGTTDLESWQSWLAHNNGPIPREWGLTADTSGVAIGVVNIARLTQCDAILPTALLACCSYRAVKTLARGYEREDGTREQLSEDDMQRCIIAIRDLAIAAENAVVLAIAVYDMQGCESKESCRAAIQALLRENTVQPGFLLTDSPFGDWECYMTEFFDEDMTCDDCFFKLKDRFLLEQRRIWARLPGILGITVEGWPNEEDSNVNGNESSGEEE